MPTTPSTPVIAVGGVGVRFKRLIGAIPPVIVGDPAFLKLGKRAGLL